MDFQQQVSDEAATACDLSGFVSPNSGPRLVSDAQPAVMDPMRKVGLEKFEGHYRHELSQGMRQRVGLAQALVNSPDLLLILTQGGPGRATQVLSLYAFQTAYKDFNFGYAGALSVVMFVLLMLFAWGYVRLSRVNEE